MASTMAEPTTGRRRGFFRLGALVLIVQSVLLLVMHWQGFGDAFSVATWDSKQSLPVESNDNMALFPSTSALDLVQAPTLTAVPTRSGPRLAPTTPAPKHETRILPSSSPPKTVELLSVDHPGIRQRHECIAKIRARHEQLLAPLVTPSADHPHVLLVDPSYHENVGDNMLTLGELTFLERRGFAKCKQCHYQQAEGFYPPCEQVIGSNPPATTGYQAALWHAGGNWGNLYRSVHLKRMKSFSSLLAANYSIVGMPQSFHYDNKGLKESDAALIKSKIIQGLFSPTQDVSILSNATALERVQSRVTFTWREHESYDQAVKLYPFVNNLLVPDIAFQLGPFLPIPPTGDGGVDIVLFLRTDKESTQKAERSSAAVQKLLNAIPGGKDLSFTIVDWNSRLAMFNSKDKLFTDTAIQLLSLGKVVICDRLHASILSYLAGLPFVYINQSTGKVENTLRVAFESWEGCQDGETSMYASAQNLQDALGKAIQFLDNYDLKKTKTAVSAPLISCPHHKLQPRSDADTQVAEGDFEKAKTFVLSHQLTFLKEKELQFHRDLVRDIESQGIPGMMLECGVAKAGSAIVLSAYKQPQRCLHLFDTFEGIPPPSDKDGQDAHIRYQAIQEGRGGGKNYYGHMKDLLGFDQHKFQESGFLENRSVSFHKGLFQDTVWPGGPIAYAHLDGDWYESTYVMLQRISPHLSVGGYVVLDDVLHWSGARDAFSDFFEVDVDWLQGQKLNCLSVKNGMRFSVFVKVKAGVRVLPPDGKEEGLPPTCHPKKKAISSTQ